MRQLVDRPVEEQVLRLVSSNKNVRTSLPLTISRLCVIASSSHDLLDLVRSGGREQGGRRACILVQSSLRNVPLT
jgi:hypothetical protein